jgi:hypothetical protein
MRLPAAFHESAHACVAVRLGYVVSWARIDDRGGRVMYDVPRSEHDAIVILISGTIAQRRVAPHSPIGVTDGARMAALPVDRYWAEAEALVTELWPRIEALAARLLERSHLDGIEVEQVGRGMEARWCS